MGKKKRVKRSATSRQPPLIRYSARINPEHIEESKYYDGGVSQFIREAVIHYKDHRHIFKFRDILETLAGEILILSKWKELGHPGGAEWTEELEQQLEYYETCFEMLENSPFNKSG